jgi:hypothetical protein
LTKQQPNRPLLHQTNHIILAKTTPFPNHSTEASK